MLRTLALLTIIWLATTPANAERRVALIVGNGAYEQVTELINPANDASDLAAQLRNLQFEVIEALDLDQSGMRLALSQFTATLEGADVGLFFYAGHAMQMNGVNYLLPVDASLSREADVYVQLLSLRDIMAAMEAAVPTRLVFLDACRDNPLSRSLSKSMPATRSASVSSGLARMQAPAGTLIAYATAPDQTALDGTGRNSPFTKALLSHIASPGLEARQILTRVRQGVIASTDGNQIPWDSSSLTGDFYFKLELSNQPLAAAPSSPIPAAPATATQPASTSAVAKREEDNLGFNQVDRSELQSMLEMLGYNTGGIDGRFGPNTRVAISRWQRETGLPPSGFLDAASYTALLTDAGAAMQKRDRLISGEVFAEIAMADLLAGDEAASAKLIELAESYVRLFPPSDKIESLLKNLKSGEPWGAVDLGWYLNEGDPIPKQPIATTRLFGYAAGKGFGDGIAALGHRYYEGRGVEEDKHMSFEMYQRAAELDIPEGYYGIGLHHQWGTAGLSPDIGTAIANYEKSAELGYWWAMVELGNIYSKGEQIEPDFAKAKAYYEMVTTADTPGWAAKAVKRAQAGLERIAQ